ncbi:MAG: hypothetical protein K2V38_02120, partial [Gemmataceae bacterium]|nr:hypothetical protein [Gemmataceae bacterium]
FHAATVAQVRALAKCPSARLLRELVVSYAEGERPNNRKNPYVHVTYKPGPDVPPRTDPHDAPSLHALLHFPHLEGVRRFQLGDGTPVMDGQPEEIGPPGTSGRLAHELARRMPNLEELFLIARDVDTAALFALPLPRLRVLTVYHNAHHPLDVLAANPTLTNLEVLLCRPRAMNTADEANGAYIRLEHLRALCRSPHLAKLKHLRLRLTDFGDAGVDEIVSSGLLKRLKILDLEGGSVTDVGARTLAACPDFKNLDFLNLNTNALTPTGCAVLTATGMRVSVEGQHNLEPAQFMDGGVSAGPEYLFDGEYE